MENSFACTYTYIERNNLLIMCLSSFISFAFMLYFFYKTKKSKPLLSFLSLNLAIIACSLASIIVILFDDRNQLQIIGFWVTIACMCSICILWINFCFSFTNLSKTVKKYIMLTSLILPAIYLTYFTYTLINSYSYIIFLNQQMTFSKNYLQLLGIMFLYLVLGQTVLIRLSILKSNKKTHKILIISTGIIFATVFFLRIFFNVSLEFIPILFITSSTLALYMYSLENKLFRIMPISILTFTESIDQAMCLADSNSNIIGLNSAFISMFGDESITLENKPLDKLSQYLKSKMPTGQEQSTILDYKDAPLKSLDRIKLCLDKERVFTIAIQPIYNNRSSELAKLILFNDITEVNNISEQLLYNNKNLVNFNSELYSLSSNLTHDAINIEELSIQKERSRILTDLHDSIGQIFTSNFSLLQCAKKNLKKNDISKTMESLLDIKRITEEGLHEIEKSLNLESSDSPNQNLSTMLLNLASNYSESIMRIQFVFNGNIDNLNSNLNQIIYKTVQESATNSYKHGKANKVMVSITIDSNNLTIDISDDGEGCSSIKKGIGLAGMERRLGQVNGKLSYTSDINKGFAIKADIPLSLGEDANEQQ